MGFAGEMLAGRFGEMPDSTIDAEHAAITGPVVPTLRDAEPHELRNLLKSGEMPASEAAELSACAMRNAIYFYSEIST